MVEDEPRGGRHIAEWLLTEYCTEMGAPDGSFLVRENEILVGDCILSIYCNRKVQHCHILWQQDASIHRFFLTDSQAFDSLYDFITHHQEMPLSCKKIEMRLTELVPQSSPCSNTDWVPRDGTRGTMPVPLIIM